MIVVDAQNDFCPKGALPVAEGDQIIPVLNRYIEKFNAAGLPVFATRDWHPERTSHFNHYGGFWPPHCIQGTVGAQFHPDLALTDNVIVISKGMGADEDAYSGFQAVDAQGVPLAVLLRRLEARRLFVGGLATDYCIKQTVLDGLKEGFRVILLEDAIRGVDVRPGDSRRSIEEMIQAGAQIGEGI